MSAAMKSIFGTGDKAAKQSAKKQSAKKQSATVARNAEARNAAAAKANKEAIDSAAEMNAEAEAKKAEAAPKKSSSRAHVWKKTDPLKFPPSMYTKGVFKANFPFIQVVEGEEKMPSFNKFSMDLRTAYSVRRAAMKECAEEIARSWEVYGVPDCEERSLEHHSSLFRNLEKFTVPSQAAMADLEVKQNMLESASATGRKRKRVDISELEDLADQRGLMLDLIQEQRLSGSTNEEGLEDDNDEDGRGAADIIKLYVWAKRSKETELGQKLDSDISDDRKLVAVIERKFNTDEEHASYQGAKYVCDEVKRNIKNRHYSPIYVLTFSQRWKYAILHVRGFVRVKNGLIDPSSLAAFREQEKAMGFSTPVPETELAETLVARTKFYQENYSDAPMSVYPDAEYPVGKLHVSHRWRTLLDDSNGIFTLGEMHILYEGLLRIVIGDHVISWDDEKLQLVKKVRKEMRKEVEDIWMGPNTYRQCTHDT